ncbi:SDR family NAD(P)-dependent oxidoreductase [Rhodobacteraceae bacterium W635]|uniref:type I polyketide synthase n=1 Tax=Nioella halotolerans TaxID=2303578 RepID=UPI000E3DA987|nr:SDR family NAD(P)-dependent oxidoreductase [Rhodobacteraceae bacterium W635]
MTRADPPPDPGENDIAIIGMAAHLPGAPDVQAYWRNLSGGVGSIRRLSREELLAAGEAPHLIDRPDYVPFAAPLDGFERFDADFFGLSPKEAAIMDPQHRQFLEVAWEAMEQAGHLPDNFQGKTGVYAGCGMGSYFYFNVCSNRDLVDQTGMFLLRHTGNDKDFMATRASHIFDLRGPAISLQTACSTSLVATHYAAQALLTGECDMALAGGVTIELPQGRGYIHKDGEILSPDGACHAFDHRAQGTVFGSGAGCVVLRRAADAIRDGDHIWAIIKGSAVNNDGADKAGYLAPSVTGQAEAIAEAHALAGVSADSIDYVECHGTGTYLGDPIEVAALTDAFRRTTEATGFCRIGSVKTNIGHLDTAAGVASLIKAALALYHRQMPPSLGYEAPNPAIDFAGSPFTVNDRLTDWPQTDHPARAGVNSLGVGGTNAHVVLEEAPRRAASEACDWPFQLLCLSAHGKASLDGNTDRLAAHLDGTQDDLADIAWTLKEGRRAFEHRRVVVAETAQDAAAALRENDPRRVFTHRQVADDPEITFMFPGGGAQYVNMARDLYETEPVFADWMDRGLDVLEPNLDVDIRSLWLPAPDRAEEAETQLMRPSVQLPLVMIVEYALAQLWISWGVRPRALIGHSMGENTAACLAGVLSFEDCIGLVHLRGQLMETVERGGMLSVALSPEALAPYLGEDLDLAVVNGPDLTVASGPEAALDRLAGRLAAEEVHCQRIAIDIAAHSRLLDPILERFGAYLRAIPLHPPRIPVMSNRSGQILTDAEATDPDYWVAHLRGTVRFADGLATLAASPSRVYLEVGPGKALTSLAGQHPDIDANQVINSLRHPDDSTPDDAYFLATLGRIWAVGGSFDWGQYWGAARRNRVVLPTYAFQKSPYFIEPATPQTAPEVEWPMREEDPARWGWTPRWRPTYAPCEVDVSGDLSDAACETWLLFADETGLADRVGARLQAAGHVVTLVRPGDAFARTGMGYVLPPERGREGYDQLLRALAEDTGLPTRIAHLWLLTQGEHHRPGSSFFHRMQEQGFWSLFYLAQAWAEAGAGALHIDVITNGAAQVRDEPLSYPSKATVMGPARVIPREFPAVTVGTLDLEAPDDDAVLEELLSDPASRVAAHRAGKRHEQGWRRSDLPEGAMPEIREGATVLLTGGYGGIGTAVAEALIRRYKARIVLVSRSGLPPRDRWRVLLRNAAPADRTAARIRAVQRLEAAGGEVLPLAADVSNIEDMRAALAEAEAAFGPVNGVIHAAGVIDDAPILAKSPGSIEDVFTPKIHGTQVLDSLFPDGALDWMVLFSSSSTATAPAGQVDYVAANDYLNAVAKARAGGKTRVLAIDWGIWSGVGMAAEAMQARVAEPPAPSPVDLPLLDHAGFDTDGNRRFMAEWRPEDRWVLDQHRTKAGDALLPGTAYLELVAEALDGQGEHQPFEIRDLWFLRPLRAADGQTTRIRLTLPRSDQGYDLRVESAPEGAGWEQNAEAAIHLLPMAAPEPLDIPALAARMGAATRADPGGWLAAPQEAHLRFGPNWRVMREMQLGDGEGLARLTLDVHEPSWQLPPGLLDMATGWAMDLIDGYEAKALWVPVSYASVKVFRALPAELVSHVRNAAENRAEDQTARFDITLAAPDGTVCVEIAGFTIRRLAGDIAFAAAPARQAEADGPRPLSPAEERLRHAVSQGIRPEEGAEAFLKALASPVSQVVISSLDLEALIAQAGADTAEDRPSAGFDRPDLGSDFVEPEGAIKETLAGFWRDLLGVARVGAEDSFFDLGGHSLIAVRLFAMIRKRWSVDFPISVLFEAPTIRKIAALIAAQGVVDDAGQAPLTPAEPARRFTHLVPMHQGEGGPKTPFFLVAGMFGNVLNLRHLAHLLGHDRAFYGLQAKGLFGEDAPHRAIEAAARDMIAEIRQVQPEGPYMLGGFSGGGITAYEIAQQLTAAGQEVSALVMLDTPLPQRRELSRADRIAIQVQELKAGGLAYPARWLARRIRWEIVKRRRKSDAPGDGAAFHDAAIEAAFLEAVDTYRLRPWQGPLTLFRPPLAGKWQVGGGRLINSERAYVTHDNDWTEWAPRMHVHEVPGDHDSMVLEPNVRVLAARMAQVIEAADRPRQVAQAWEGRHAAE